MMQLPKLRKTERWSLYSPIKSETDSLKHGGILMTFNQSCPNVINNQKMGLWINFVNLILVHF